MSQVLVGKKHGGREVSHKSSSIFSLAMAERDEPLTTSTPPPLSISFTCLSACYPCP